MTDDINDHGATIARIDERTLLMRQDQVRQTKILSNMVERVSVVETKQKITGKSMRRLWGVLISAVVSALAWVAKVIWTSP